MPLPKCWSINFHLDDMPIRNTGKWVSNSPDIDKYNWIGHQRWLSNLYKNLFILEEIIWRALDPKVLPIRFNEILPKCGQDIARFPLLTLWNEVKFVTYLGSEINLPMVLSNPKLWAAMAAAAIVLTLFGAKKQSGLTIERATEVNGKKSHLAILKGFYLAPHTM